MIDGGDLGRALGLAALSSEGYGMGVLGHDFTPASRAQSFWSCGCIPEFVIGQGRDIPACGTGFAPQAMQGSPIGSVTHSPLSLFICIFRGDSG